MHKNSSRTPVPMRWRRSRYYLARVRYHRRARVGRNYHDKPGKITQLPSPSPRHWLRGRRVGATRVSRAAWDGDAAAIVRGREGSCRWFFFFQFCSLRDVFLAIYNYPLKAYDNATNTNSWPHASADFNGAFPSPTDSNLWLQLFRLKRIRTLFYLHLTTSIQSYIILTHSLFEDLHERIGFLCYTTCW